MYDTIMALLHAVESRSGGLFPYSQRESLDGMEQPVTAENEANEAGRERSGALDHVVRLLTPQFFSHLHAIPASKSMYSLDDEKPLNLNTLKLLQFTVPASSLVLASLSRKVVQPVRTERPAVERARVIERDDERNVVRPPATPADVGLSLEDH